MIAKRSNVSQHTPWMWQINGTFTPQKNAKTILPPLKSRLVSQSHYLSKSSHIQPHYMGLSTNIDRDFVWFVDSPHRINSSKIYILLLYAHSNHDKHCVSHLLGKGYDSRTPWTHWSRPPLHSGSYRLVQHLHTSNTNTHTHSHTSPAT